MSKRHRKPSQIERSIHDSRKNIQQTVNLSPKERTNLEYERRKASWVLPNIALFVLGNILMMVSVPTSQDQSDFWWRTSLISIWAFGLAEYGLHVSRALGYPWSLIPGSRAYDIYEHKRKKTKYFGQHPNSSNILAGSSVYIIVFLLLGLFPVYCAQQTFSTYAVLSILITIGTLFVHAVTAYLRYGRRKQKERPGITPYAKAIEPVADLQAGYFVGDDGEIEKAKRSE